MLYDIILVVFIALLAWLGKRRGLFRSLMGLCSSIVAVAATYFLRDSVLKALEATPAYANLTKMISDNITPKIASDTSSLPGFFSTAADSAGALAGNAITQLITAALITILLYLAILLALRIITGILDSVFRLPVLKQFNSLGGLLFGALSAFLLVYAALAVWGCFTAFRTPQMLWDARLLKSMFENNILMIIFS